MLGHGALSSQAISEVERSPVSGEATLSASAQLAVVGGAVRRSSAALAGKGQAIILPGAIRVAQATSTAAGSLSVAAIRVRLASASALARGTLQATGGLVARTTVQSMSRAALGIEPTSAFEDLISNPNRRLIYTIEMSPWLLVPYEDQA